MYPLSLQLMSPTFTWCISCSVYTAGEISISNLERVLCLTVEGRTYFKWQKVIKVAAVLEMLRKTISKWCKLLLHYGLLGTQLVDKVKLSLLWCEHWMCVQSGAPETLILGDWQKNWMISADDFNIFWFHWYFWGFAGLIFQWRQTDDDFKWMEMQSGSVLPLVDICVSAEILHPFGEQLLLKASGCHIGVDLLASGSLFRAHSQRDRCWF